MGSSDTPTSTAILAAIAAQAEAEKCLPSPSPDGWQVSLRAAALIREWHLPESVMTSLLVPLAERHVDSVEALIAPFKAQAINLATRLVDWRQRTPTAHLQSDLTTAYDAQLRFLFRETYLDLDNDLSFILLLLAEQDARLELDPTPSLCQQTLAVFIPLVEMLGLWALRRKWLDRSLAISEPVEYARIQSLLEKVDGAKRTAFLQLRQAFLAGAESQRLSALPNVELVLMPPGTGLRRFREGRSEEEFVERLVVRVLCRNSGDCYAALGAVHALGQPVGPRFSGRFDDYIAYPEPNGYRALFTAIRYRFRDDGGRSREMVVEARILTPQMHDLNEWGVIEAFHRNEGRFKGVSAWWNQVSDLDDDVKRRQRDAERNAHTNANLQPGGGGAPCPERLREFLTNFDIGSDSNPIYVFSPRGQLFLLDAGSTPLDFAYRVHTDIGNCIERMAVNGRSAIFQQPLRNGDCIRVHRGPACNGPDLTWVTWAATSSARSKIRRALAVQARDIHEGRLAIETVLLRRIEYYKHQKGYELVVTRRDLDAFLLNTAKSRHLHGVSSLYDDVSNGRVDPEHLVWQMVSQELACALVDIDGRQFVYPLHKFSFCDSCRPVPGESIIAYERRSYRSSESLVVHSTTCKHRLGSGQVVLVQWAQPSRWQTLADIKILAEDRAGLLGEIMDTVYKQPKIYVHRAAARTYVDGKADITLMVMVEDFHQLSELQTRIEKLHQIRQVSSYPASQAWVRTLAAVHSEWVPNPYTTDEVSDRDHFYDRHPQIETIQRWLAQETAGPLILRGQRRTGKSSLLRYLKREVLFDQRDVLPVIVNLQALTGYVDMEKLAATFLEWLYSALPKDTPTFSGSRSAADPAFTLIWTLGQIVGYLRTHSSRRLLLMVDEFDVLVRKQAREELAPDVLRSLRAIMTERRDMSWLLVIADGNYHDTNWGSAGPLIQQAQMVTTAELEAEWAMRLIFDGVHLCRLHYKGTEDKKCKECFIGSQVKMECHDCLPARIWQEAAGMPFYIQLICHDLVERVRDQRRSIITEQDLKHVTDVLLSDGRRVFDHYIRHLDDSSSSHARRAIMGTIVQHTSPGEWMPYGDLVALWTRQHATDQQALGPTIQRLKNLGMIDGTLDQQRGRVRIFPPLFHRWAAQNLLGT